MAKFEAVVLYLLQVSVYFSSGQQQARARVAPWTQRIQWENNGRVHSLLSTGSQYQPPEQAPRASRLYLSTKRESTQRRLSARPFSPSPSRTSHLGVGPSVSGSNVTAPNRVQPNPSDPNAVVLGVDAGQYIIVTRGASVPGRRGHPLTSPQRDEAGESPAAVNSAAPLESSGGGDALARDGGGARAPGRTTPTGGPLGRAGRRASVPEGSRARFSDRIEDGNPLSNRTSRIGTGHRNTASSAPEEASDTGEYGPSSSKDHSNSVFHDVYPNNGGPTPRVQRLPGSGYGTRYFHHGKERLYML